MELTVVLVVVMVVAVVVALAMVEALAVVMPVAVVIMVSAPTQPVGSNGRTQDLTIARKCSS